MKQVFQNMRTGKILIEEIPAPALKSNGLLVRNHVSLISAGTEKMIAELAKKNLLDKARERPDLVKQVVNKIKTEGVWSTFQKVISRLETPVPLGYSCAGVVEKLGKEATEFQVGHRVACAGATYANHAEYIFALKNLCVKVPANVDLESAAFTTVGAIALQGVRTAEVSVGETVLVIGLGLVGQLTAQILKAAGCTVVGIDVEEWKVGLAIELGLDEGFLSGPHLLSSRLNAITNGYGFDAVIITAATESNQPIELAGELARNRAKVVVVGAVEMDIPRKIYYEKELQVRLSRSYGPGRYDPVYEEKGVDYPYEYVRWTERRNMEAFLDLVAKGKLNLKRLITHRFAIEEALKGYDLITGKTKEAYLGIILQYTDTNERAASTTTCKVYSLRPKASAQHVKVGFIGAGNFAKSVLLPRLKKFKEVGLVGVATSTGMSAKYTAHKFGFAYGTTDYHEIIEDEDINTVFIATRHDLHASLVMEALRRRKHVFVEKPLCINEHELREIAGVLHDRSPVANDRPLLMVGFNRRFSPFAREVADFFRDRKEPMAISYRVNAGAMPKDSWVHDPSEGGNRIIGEVCHFVDLITFWTNSKPMKVFAESVSNGSSGNESAIIVLHFADGSLGSIAYVTNGDRSLPKERIEVFGDSAVAVIDDFSRLSLTRNGKKRTVRRLGQDKGHYGEVQAFIKAVQRGSNSLPSHDEIIWTTLTTFKVMDSLLARTPVAVELEAPGV